MVVARIYRIENRINNLIYIGLTIQSLNKRMYTHIADANRGYQTKLHSLMRQIGYGHFYIILIREIQCQDLDQARIEEQIEIDKYAQSILLNENDAIDANEHRRNYMKYYYHQNRTRLCQYQCAYNRQHYG
jgi:hypothetical protein